MTKCSNNKANPSIPSVLSFLTKQYQHPVLWLPSYKSSQMTANYTADFAPHASSLIILLVDIAVREVNTLIGFTVLKKSVLGVRSDGRGQL